MWGRPGVREQAFQVRRIAVVTMRENPKPGGARPLDRSLRGEKMLPLLPEFRHPWIDLRPGANNGHATGAVRLGDGELLRDAAAHRRADDMRRGNAKRIEQ